jgi:AcrR family transcriptional regulator
MRRDPESAGGVTAGRGPQTGRARKRGRPTGDHQAKSRELIDAARAVIAQDGYAGASLRKVALRLGRTTGAVTYYYASKEEMINSVTESLFDEYDEGLEKDSDQIDIESIIGRLTVWATPDKKGAWMVWFHLVAHAATNPGLASVFRRRNAQAIAKLAALLERCQQQGVVRSDFSADLLADLLSSMADGWFMMAPVEPARFKRKRVNDLVRLAIAMLTPPSGDPGRRGGA